MMWSNEKRAPALPRERVAGIFHGCLELPKGRLDRNAQEVPPSMDIIAAEMASVKELRRGRCDGEATISGTQGLPMGVL